MKKWMLWIGVLLFSQVTQADETCMSPYMAKIVGQEDFVYIWTLGVEGLGDEQDKLVTVSVNPNAEDYGDVVNSLSVGARNEAHHSGFTDDRRYLWASGLDSNKIFIFDVHTDPRKPTLYKTIDDFGARARMAKDQAQGPQDEIVAEMIKAIPWTVLSVLMWLFTTWTAVLINYIGKVRATKCVSSKLRGI